MLIDLETWQELDVPADRSRQVRVWAHEFLTQCSDEKRQEFRKEHEQARQWNRRIRDYKIDPQAVRSGQLVSYADILGGARRALSDGGNGSTYHWVHQERLFLVEDQYCPNPDCDCREVLLQFWERVHPEAVITQRFRGSLTFDGRLGIAKLHRCTHQEAESILEAWWQTYDHDMEMLQARYHRVKEIGGRCLDNAPTPVPAVQSPATMNSASSSVRRASSRQRVGRNEPCPCGSGKKFKRCCAKKLSRAT